MTLAACPKCKSKIAVIRESEGHTAICINKSCDWEGRANKVPNAGFTVFTNKGKWLGHSFIFIVSR